MQKNIGNVFGGAAMSSVASVKDRLSNKSKETGKTMQEMLTLYGLERTIYRLSVSEYKEHFTLKGVLRACSGGYKI